MPTNFAAILCLLTLFSNYISCSNLLFFCSILPTLIYILSFLFVVSLLPHFLIHHQQLSRPLQPCVSSFSMHYLNTLALFPALQPSSLTRSQPTIHHFCDHCNHACHIQHTYSHSFALFPVMQPLANPIPTCTYYPCDYCSHVCLTSNTHISNHPCCFRSLQPLSLTLTYISLSLFPHSMYVYI